MAWRIKWLRVTPERIPAILGQINYGPEPAVRYYALVATSALIATFGLIANNVAVIIGAMVVAPLMTPVFGLALALVRGDAKLLGRALQAQNVGGDSVRRYRRSVWFPALKERRNCNGKGGFPDYQSAGKDLSLVPGRSHGD